MADTPDSPKVQVDGPEMDRRFAQLQRHVMAAGALGVGTIVIALVTLVAGLVNNDARVDLGAIVLLAFIGFTVAALFVVRRVLVALRDITMALVARQ